MAFGKTSLDRLPPPVLEKLEENRVDKVVHQTEVKMLRPFDPGTPMGGDAMLAAVEETMVAGPKVCSQCKEEKTDLELSRTGTCRACWLASEWNSIDPGPP